MSNYHKKDEDEKLLSCPCVEREVEKYINPFDECWEARYYDMLMDIDYKDDDGVLQYGFETQTDGNNTCKSPMGMFEESFIENDLQYVKDCIIKYEQ